MSQKFDFKRYNYETTDEFQRRITYELLDEMELPEDIAQSVGQSITDECNSVCVLREPSEGPWAIEVRRPWQN